MSDQDTTSVLSSGSSAASGPPDLLPILSRGRHRSPRKGACFMELASYLAGERWSDHPACTHPLLAALARDVNDLTADAGRAALAPLVPSVIGVTSQDPHVDARIALECARRALPVVASECQRDMAVSVLAAERVLAELDGRPAGTLSMRSRWALAQAPAAAKWAVGFTKDVRTSLKAFRRDAAPSIVRYSVEGISQACVSDPNRLLRELLEAVISDCRGWLGLDGRADAEPADWAAVCRLTGTS